MNNKIYLITRELFFVLLSALVIFIAMEFVNPNIIQAYININFVLILWLASAIVLVLTNKNIHL